MQSPDGMDKKGRQELTAQLELEKGESTTLNHRNYRHVDNGVRVSEV
jgi:hypothetical protein